jgi:hypothetical protein
MSMFLSSQGSYFTLLKNSVYFSLDSKDYIDWESTSKLERSKYLSTGLRYLMILDL